MKSNAIFLLSLILRFLHLKWSLSNWPKRENCQQLSLGEFPFSILFLNTFLDGFCLGAKRRERQKRRWKIESKLFELTWNWKRVGCLKEIESKWWRWSNERSSCIFSSRFEIDDNIFWLPLTWCWFVCKRRPHFVHLDAPSSILNVSFFFRLIEWSIVAPLVLPGLYQGIKVNSRAKKRNGLAIKSSSLSLSPSSRKEEKQVV